MKEKMEAWGIAIFVSILTLLQFGDRLYATSHGLESDAIHVVMAFLPVCFFALAEQRRRMKAELKQINDQLLALQTPEQ